MPDTNILPLRGTTVPDAKLQCFAFNTVSGGGTPLASSYQGFGISNITYAATGTYTVTFDNADFMANVVFVSATVKDGTTGTPDTNGWIATCYWDVTASGGPSLVIQVRGGTSNLGTAADPAAILQVSVLMVVNASGVGYGYT